MSNANTSAAIANVRRAIESGAILHSVDTSGCPLTAGRVAVPGGEPRWSVLRFPPPGYGKGGEPIEDDCGSLPALARVFVRTYVGAVKANEAADRAA